MAPAPVQGRLVEVAVDAPAGPGPRTYTYLVPDGLEDLETGEAVLVPFGKGGRQAIGIVIGEGTAPPGGELRPLAARIRSDGPLLPPLALAFSALLAGRYLAPLAVVIRAMLPPGMLERLELMAEVTPAGEARMGRTDPGLSLPDLDLLDELAGRARPVRDLSSPEGRAALLRRLRALADEDLVDLTWTLLGAAVGPRYERRLWVTADGRSAASAVAAGERLHGRPLGPRQRDALAELSAMAQSDPAGVAASAVVERFGSSSIAGLVRRGLVRAEVRERPRRPLAGRPAPTRGARPPGSVLTGDQAAALRLVTDAIAARDTTPILLDGVTGGGKTAIYVEAIAASLAAGRPAMLLVPEIALATPIVDRLRAELPARIAVLHSALGDGERADEWRRIRAGDADLVVGTRTALLAPLADVGLIVVDEEHDAAYKSDRTPEVPGAGRGRGARPAGGRGRGPGLGHTRGRDDGSRAFGAVPAGRAAGARGRGRAHGGGG